MRRRRFIHASLAASVGTFAAGCSDGATDGEPTPADLLGSGDVAVGGLSVDAPDDGSGGVEYYRAVAGIENTSGDTIDYALGTIEFLDGDGSVLDHAGGDLVGFPDGRWWALVGEYGGDDPNEVADVRVGGVDGIPDADLADARDAGDVELANVTADPGPGERTAVVSGDATNVADDAVDDLTVIATLWVAEDRAVASAMADVGSLDPGETRRFEATHRFSPNSAHLVPIVTEENDVTVPYVGPRPPLDLCGE